MANEIKELREQIAVSFFLCPCNEEELGRRDFLKTISYYGIGMQLQKLDCLDATFYKGEVIHIKKEWAEKNLKGYDLDFRTEKQKNLDSMTTFAKAVLGYN